MSAVYRLLLLFFIAGLFTSCSTTRHIPEGAYLLRKQKINLKTDKKLADRGILLDELKAAAVQRPNSYLLGFIPYKVWLYNMRYEKYQKDTANFQITSRVVEKPVVLDTNLLRRTRENFESLLRNEGYFYAEVSDTVLYREKKATVRFDINTHKRYMINHYEIALSSPELEGLLPRLSKNTLLTPGKWYSHILAGEERNRLVDEVRNRGYYRFSVDNISIELDTLDKAFLTDLDDPFESVAGGFEWKRSNVSPVDVRVIIHPGIDSLAFQKFVYKNVVVFPDYREGEGITGSGMQTDTINGLEIRYHKKYLNNQILDKKVFIRPGATYSQEQYNQTLRQLNDLGVFQYVRVLIFQDRRDSLNNTLNAYILMAPSEKFDLNANVEVSGGNLYVIGTAANLSLTNRNLLRGANQFTTTLSYGLEMRQSTRPETAFLEQFEIFSQSLGVNFRLDFPKFLLPVNQRVFSQRALPRSVMELGWNSLERRSYFSLHSFNASFGYIWRETATKSWIVKPAFVHLLNLYDIHPGFQQRMDSIPAIRNSYQETFIEGESIEFVWNTEGRHPAQHTFLKLGLEESGALISGVKELSAGFGSPLNFKHAQYLRFDFDARQYLLRNNTSFVFRFYGGVGLPYGQSTILPYLKQYFVGGAYSIRGWRPRVLGPGSFYDAENQQETEMLFIDQAGDIKLELNAEYRFGLVKLFSGGVNINGALFADAGNIWLARKQVEMPGAEFRLNRLYHDLAMSTGAGLRLDLGGFLVLRVDWAFPVKLPYSRDDEGWVIDEVALGDPQWRRKNLNMNIAIGYPF